jgi:hypothetical protein
MLENMAGGREGPSHSWGFAWETSNGIESPEQVRPHVCILSTEQNRGVELVGCKGWAMLKRVDIRRMNQSQRSAAVSTS